MAGMSDNPLVGEYTKGISKGPAYLKALEFRVRWEKANMKLVAQDLQMDILRQRSVAATGTGRFATKSHNVAKENVVKINSFEPPKNDGKKKWFVVPLSALKLYI